MVEGESRKGPIAGSRYTLIYCVDSLPTVPDIRSVTNVSTQQGETGEISVKMDWAAAEWLHPVAAK